MVKRKFQSLIVDSNAEQYKLYFNFVLMRLHPLDLGCSTDVDRL